MASAQPAFRLIVTEKPSVARDIGRVLGITRRKNGYLDGGKTRITWCVGHLLQLAEPKSYNPEWKSWRLSTLPMVPERFTLQPRNTGADQYAVVAGLLEQAAEVVNACDAGREGELIFAWVYEAAGCKAPTKRLWISSMTDSAIRKGFDALRDGERLNDLADAARCRAESDWLVGLNATRAMTARFSQGAERVLLSVGRVQTPTLAVLVRRRREIEAFEPQTFWQVKARLHAEKGDWEAIWIRRASRTRPHVSDSTTKADKKTKADQKSKPGKNTKDDGRRDRIHDKAEAEAIRDRLVDAEGKVSRVERKKSREKPPLLYDLTSLQKEANRRFKFSAKRTLEIAQALYETHKVLTYPRTDSRHLPRDEVAGLPDKLRGIAFGPYEATARDALDRWPIKLSKRVVDDTEVSDHHAIIPTGIDARRCNLSVDEKRVFDLVARRFLAVMQPDAVFAVVQMTASFGEDHLFARGRTCLEPGWRAIDPPASDKRGAKKAPTGKKKGAEASLLPPVEKGDDVKVLKPWLHEGTTKPPRHYTEATLLAAMEGAGDQLDDAELKRAMKRNGLGTPATRAAIIETLLARNYVERKSAQMIATDHGCRLLDALPFDGLTSPKLTGSWEARLVAMAEGNDDRTAFMADIALYTAQIVAAIRGVDADAVKQAGFEAPAATGEVLAACPLCGSEVRQARYGWSCVGCAVHVPGRVAQREISPRMAKTLLKSRQTKAVKGFTSKAGKKFSAALHLTDEGKVEFSFPDPDPIGDCPECGKPVRPRGTIYTCDTGRSCKFVVFAEIAGHKVKLADVKALLTDGATGLIEGLKTRDERRFDGVLAWQNGRVRAVEVDQRELVGKVGACPTCGQDVAFSRGQWRCAKCSFRLPGAYMQRPLFADDVADLLAGSRTFRIFGFRAQGKGGKPFKASLVRDGVRLSVDYDASQPDKPLPVGAPRPAFGHRVDCPMCMDNMVWEPGYVIRGKAAWGCSRWRAGCRLKLPFVVAGRTLTDEDARRLLSKHRATTYAKGYEGIKRAGGTARIVLVTDGKQCWQLQERGAAKSSTNR